MPDPLAPPDDALRLRLAALEARPPTGRRPRAPETADARLVARACAALGLTRGELAGRLGVAQSILSRANGPAGLAEHHRERLRAWLAGGKDAADEAPVRKTKATRKSF